MTISQNGQIEVLILAAGLGTRMRSNRAKVLHELDGRPLIAHVCDAALGLSPGKIYTVVGYQAADVQRAVLNEVSSDHAEFPVQRSQLGTGDAVNAAREYLEDRDSTLLVLSGDVPLIKTETLTKMIDRHLEHRGKGAACTMLTVELDDPNGYGRVVRSETGFERIVEQKDASENELKIKEINAGIYCFDTKRLFEALSEIDSDNAQGEYYLTDVPGLLKKSGDSVSIFKHSDTAEIEGVNDRRQLAAMEKKIRKRVIRRLMRDQGVTFIDPKNVYISSAANIGRDCVIYPNVVIDGETQIGEACTIRSGTRISNSRIGKDVNILDNCVITDAEVSDNCNVGPFAHLRPMARMEEGSRVGNFVEMKKTVLGKNSKANHLSYLGDATIGENTNIGAGTITCNYDGKDKHATEIGNNVRIGSDTMLVAPIKIGDGAATGAGSIVTKDVPENKLAVGSPARAIKTLKNDE